MSTVLVTGGAGFIGSHTVINLLEEGFEVVIYDNFSNSNIQVIERLEKITSRKINYVNADVRDIKALSKVMQDFKVNAVIHFAGLKAVGESTEKPLLYYSNNIQGTLILIEAMKKNNVELIIFSSSATIYGDSEVIPYKEDTPSGNVKSPYGFTKYAAERIIKDETDAKDSNIRAVSLRYFNPVGAHKSSLIGEDPKGIPNNLTPYITQVAIGKREFLQVFGNDYQTPDGTGVRDYIHVLDLADAHTKALQYMQTKSDKHKVWNIGTGKGSSVLEVVKAFEEATGKQIPIKFTDRRDGDIAMYYADTTLAENELLFKAKYSLKEMALDAWMWQKNNPNGFS